MLIPSTTNAHIARTGINARLSTTTVTPKLKTKWRRPRRLYCERHHSSEMALRKHGVIGNVAGQ